MLANSYYPRANAGLAHGKKSGGSPTPRLHTIDAILDTNSLTKPLLGFDANLHVQSYGSDKSGDGSTTIPSRPEGFSDAYLYPTLSQNERLRLTMLWYYTKDLLDDEEILEKIRVKVDLVKTLFGWEFAICGLVDSDVFRRIVTTGLPEATLPRRESTCAHTVQQTAGPVFVIPDMLNDWRFAQSPSVCQGGLRSYAGAQLRCPVDNGQDIALGSLCVASNTPNRTLNPSELDTLVKLADMLTEDIINASQRKRADQQVKNNVLLREAFAASLGDLTDVAILEILDHVFPGAQIVLLPCEDH